MEKQYKRGAEILSNSEALKIMENGGLIYMGFGANPDTLYKLENNVLKYFSHGVWIPSFAEIHNFLKSKKFVAKSAQWFDNIPSHGILCHVWDNYASDSSIQIVVGYNKDMMYKFKTIYDDYHNAEPLTKEEITEYFMGE